VIEASEDVFRLAEEHAAGVGQRHVMPAPIEQGDTDFRFELADLLAQRGLRGVEARGGAGEIQLVRHGHEVPQMTQFHHEQARRRGGEWQR
jgi:hypothetical protein